LILFTLADSAHLEVVMKLLLFSRFSPRPLLILAALVVLASHSAVAAVKDAEAASHADDAATQTLVKTYEFPGVNIVQLNLAVLSHYSYMLISGNDALVVDPDRDIQAYLEMAGKEGWTIKGIFLTHSHADFVAGHTEMVHAVGCPIYQNKTSGAQYPIQALEDGALLPLGEATLQFIASPGHTPDGMVALVLDKNKRPSALLSGDTLFVGSIGRPDLMGGTLAAADLAGMSFDTWHNKLSKLDDGVVVLPAHGAGSLCGAHLSDEPSSTIGAERTSNPYLQHTGKNDFITAVLEGLPDAPAYFKYNAAMNRNGPPLVDWNAALLAAPLDTSLTDASKFYVVDLRDAQSFAAGHIPNSVNIALRGRVETWTGIMVPWGSPVVLCGSPEETAEAAYRLHRVGYNVSYALPFDAWKNASLPTYQNEPISASELYRRMQDGTAPIIVDVRLPAEWMGLRIGNVVNIPLNQLDSLAPAKLSRDNPVVTVCNSAYRSSLGIGVLERNGFKQVGSMVGGSEAWIQAGFPTIQPMGPGTAASQPKRSIKLPDAMEPAQLKRMLMDLPGTFDLVDIRPPEHFKDYNLPGALNVDLGELISNPAYLVGSAPLVIVDRDGSLAMAVGGILAQKTNRPIKVLFGGLEAYWNNTGIGSAIQSVPLAPAAPKAPAAAPVQAPVAPKKKSAGC
jgi:rhodanese-related sulfurtransferase/glyoxylase-like metal-dependent hydrolase (beta-lactamase superfamily II)